MIDEGLHGEGGPSGLTLSGYMMRELIWALELRSRDVEHEARWVGQIGLSESLNPSDDLRQWLEERYHPISWIPSSREHPWCYEGRDAFIYSHQSHSGSDWWVTVLRSEAALDQLKPVLERGWSTSAP